MRKAKSLITVTVPCCNIHAYKKLREKDDIFLQIHLLAITFFSFPFCINCSVFTSVTLERCQVEYIGCLSPYLLPMNRNSTYQARNCYRAAQRLSHIFQAETSRVAARRGQSSGWQLGALASRHLYAAAPSGRHFPARPWKPHTGMNTICQTEANSKLQKTKEKKTKGQKKRMTAKRDISFLQY